MALPDLKPVSRKYVWAYHDNVTTPGSAFAVAPFKGRIVKAGTVIYNATTSADTNFTFEINGTAVTGLAWTITTSGSAAGDVDSAVPTSDALSLVKEGDTIEWVSDGGGATTTPAMCWAEIEMN